MANLPRPQTKFKTRLAGSLTDGGSENEVYLDSVPTQYPGLLTISPNTQKSETIYYATIDATNKKVTGVVRGIQINPAVGVPTEEVRYSALCLDHSASEEVEMANGPYEQRVIDILTGLRPMTSNLDMGTKRILNLPTPTLPAEAATKSWVESLPPIGVNASETLNGVVQEATQPQVDAGTATGSTGAKLFITPAKLLAWAWKTATDAVLPTTNEKTLLTNFLALANGFVKKTGSGTFSSQASLTEADISTSDVTTLNASTTKHGFAPKGTGDTSQFLNGSLGWTSIPSTGYAALSSTTLASAATSITCTGINKKYLRVFFYSPILGQSVSNKSHLYFQFNSDTSSLYRYLNRGLALNPAADPNLSSSSDQNSATHSTKIEVGYYYFGGQDRISFTLDILNEAALNKEIVGQSVSSNMGDNSGYTCYAHVLSATWLNTSSQISSITVTCPTGNFPIGTTLRVIGSDF